METKILGSPRVNMGRLRRLELLGAWMHGCNPSVPGTNAQASGTITYTGGIQGSFEAGIERENGQWRLSKVWIVVPPEKLEGNPEANRQLDEDLTAWVSAEVIRRADRHPASTEGCRLARRA